MSERPASADSARSGSSVNSIPPLPPLPASSGSTFPPQRSSVISINSQIDGKNKFSASFLATPSTVSSPVKNLQKRLLTKEWNQRKKYFLITHFLSKITSDYSLKVEFGWIFSSWIKLFVDGQGLSDDRRRC